MFVLFFVEYIFEVAWKSVNCTKICLTDFCLLKGMVIWCYGILMFVELILENISSLKQN